MKRIAVIGGGASGLMAAIAAAEQGCSVTIFEKTDRLGRKIPATGNGRCNLSNLSLGQEPVTDEAYHGSAKTLFLPVFTGFDLEKTLDFFRSIGIPVRSEGERLYPYNLQAASVIDALRDRVERDPWIEIRLEQEVRGMQSSKGRWQVQTSAGKASFDAVILTAGGKAAPQLGTDGSGPKLAEATGLHVTSLSPALVKLQLGSPYCKRLSGLRLDACVKILWDGKVIRTCTDEIIFTDDGISGSAVFMVSQAATTLLEQRKQPMLELDLFPEMEAEDLFILIRQILDSVSWKPILEGLNGTLHKKLIPVLLKETDISKDRTSSSIKDGEIRTMIGFLKHWKMKIIGHGGFKNAQVTAGGIDGTEIGTDLQMKRFPGLYAAGEVIDIDGDCGGFNLQWAWSSGYIAGKNAAEQKG
ncbi:MAG: aminoacetone oxidase family FAD-binding enzyme [Clostridiales bacterium]|nr:aminoacetone oxidase family FAD-binding enzyme [Clostridiales bacterium]